MMVPQIGAERLLGRAGDADVSALLTFLPAHKPRETWRVLPEHAAVGYDRFPWRHDPIFSQAVDQPRAHLVHEHLRIAACVRP